MTHGVRELAERVSRLDPYLAFTVGRDESRDASHYVRLDAEPAVLEAWVSRVAAAYGSRLGLPADRTSQAAFIILDAGWYACAPLVAAYLGTGAIPRLAGAEVWLDGTRLGTLAVTHHDVRRPATIDDLRDEIETAMAPLLAAVVGRRWIGPRPAWWGLGDRIVGAFEHVGTVLGNRDRARAEAEAFIHHSGSRLDSPRHRFLDFEHAGHRRSVGLRASCCRFYRVPGVERCLTCPLVPEPERRERLEAWMEEELQLAAATSS